MARASFVATACGSDEALRGEVEALLAHAQAAEGFLSTPLEELAARALTDERGASLLGRSLGPYHIRAHLGSGGMGDVYRAHDTKLGREVAIKFLPHAFTRDPDRLARFAREARVLASLNHPHIGAIYGFEEADGLGGLVLELVEGETLADRLRRGPVPIAEALTIAGQIADALDAAHEKGIVHRDLKPANVKITPDGVVKVLDFGLAKVYAREGAQSDLSQSPTITDGGTHEAVILGTAGYMSPEQARGQAIDKRTDVWAFGSVLYEMLCGRAAFARGTVTDTLAAIVERDPDWRALPADTPLSIQRLLARCLEKHPKRRLHDIADARIEIEDAQDRPSAAMVEMSATASAAVQSRPFPSRRGALYTAVILAALATGLAVWQWRRPAEAPRPVMRFQIDLPEQMRLTADNPGVAISPDGVHVAYVANDRLYLRGLNEPTAAEIWRTDAGGISGSARTPFFSPDGQWIAFWQQNKLLKVAVSGGSAVTICDTLVSVPVGPSWEPNGDILFATLETSIMRVPATGGTPEPVIPLKKGERASNPQTLSGGEWIFFQVYTGTASADQGEVVVQSRATGERRVLIKGAQDARYVRSGHIVYGRGNTLLAQAFNPDRRTLSGGPVPVLDGVANVDGIGLSAPSLQFAVSSTGTMLYVSGSVAGATALTRLVVVTRDGKSSPLIENTGMTWFPRFSPDGARVAYGVSAGESLADQADLWVFDLARSVRTRVTFAGNNRFLPIWTRDGARLTFADGSGTTNRLLSALADGRSGLETLLGEDVRRFPTSWSPDGRTLAFYAADNAATRDIWMLHVDGATRTPKPFVVTPFEERGAIFAPSGRWVAYVSNKSGRNEIHATPYPGPGSEVTMSVGGGQEPVWGPAGRELFYRNDGKLLAVRVEESAASLTVGAPTRVFDDHYRVDTSSARGGNSNYDISPDGQRFVMVEEPGPASARGGVSQTARLHLILNWFEELKAKVPRN